MKLRIRHALLLLLAASMVLFLYTLFHEMGHGIVGIAAGGTIDRLVLGFNARISMSGAVYTACTLPLMNVMGVLLPYLLFSLVTLFYDSGYRSFFYQTFHALYVYIILGSMLPWIFIPVLSFYRLPPPGDDVTNFLISSGLPPFLITVVAILMFGLFLYLAIGKGIVGTYYKILKRFMDKKDRA